MEVFNRIFTFSQHFQLHHRQLPKRGTTKEGEAVARNTEPVGFERFECIQAEMLFRFLAIT